MHAHEHTARAHAHTEKNLCMHVARFVIWPLGVCCEGRVFCFWVCISPQQAPHTHTRTQARAHARTHEHEHSTGTGTAARAHQHASTHTRAWQVPAGPSDSPKAPGGPSAVADMPPGVSKKKFRSGPKRGPFFCLFGPLLGIARPAAARCCVWGGPGLGHSRFSKKQGGE